MSTTPPYAPLWAGIRPKLREMRTDRTALVYCYLLTRLDYRSGRCDPTISTIATDLGVKDDTVRAALKRLESIGVMVRDRREGKSDNFNFPPLDIRTADPSPAEGALPHSGGTPATGEHSRAEGGESSPAAGGESSPAEGAEEEAYKKNPEKKRKSAALGAADAAPSHPPDRVVQADRTVHHATSSASAASPASPSALKAGPARKTRSASKSPALSDSTISAITADTSLTTMAAYWLFGPEAVGKPQDEWKALPTSQTNWAPLTAVYAKPEADCGKPALAAFVWLRTCWARVADGQSLALPNFGKLSGTVSGLCDRVAQEGVIGHIERIAMNWPAIKSALSWMSSPPPLDELLLTNRHVLELSDRLARGENITTTKNANTGPAPRVTPGFAESLQARANRALL